MFNNDQCKVPCFTGKTLLNYLINLDRLNVLFALNYERNKGNNKRLQQNRFFNH